MSDKYSPHLTVLRGGLDKSIGEQEKIFVNAYVTDTRLMGVIGVCIHWKLPENTVHTDLYQFFYFDAEEFGFDTYRSVLTGSEEEDMEILESVENSLIGGLGGCKVDLSETQARCLIQEYADMNARLNIPLPDGEDEYSFLLTPVISLGETDQEILMSKQCSPLDSHFQVINYFLMRCFAKDFTAAKFLTKNYVRTNIFTDFPIASLLKNTIDPAPDRSGYNTSYHSTDSDNVFGTFHTHKAYLCESLVGFDDEYHLVVTQITLDNLHVVGFEKVSSFRISSAEASMMLARPEYITVFDLFEDAPPFRANTTQLSKRAMITEHESGTLYMIFYPHNDHVGRQTFLLNDDVLGTYFLSESGQLIISAFSPEGIHAMERDFFSSNYRRYTVLISKYEFKEPVLFDFISSDFDDFEDFVAFIAEDPPDGPDI